MLDEAGYKLWELLIQNNKDLFLSISSDARIGFLPMEVFNSMEGCAIIFGIENGCDINLSRIGFSGFQQLPADILFVARKETLEKIHNEELGSFKQCVRRREILFYILVSSEELKNKGYTFFLDSLGMGFLGTCVG